MAQPRIYKIRRLTHDDLKVRASVAGVNLLFSSINITIIVVASNVLEYPVPSKLWSN